MDPKPYTPIYKRDINWFVFFGVFFGVLAVCVGIVHLYASGQIDSWLEPKDAWDRQKEAQQKIIDQQNREHFSRLQAEREARRDVNPR